MNGLKVAAGAIGVACIVLAVGLVWAYTYYTSSISDKNTTISNIDSQVSDLQNQKNQIQAWLDANRTAYENYASSHGHANSDYDSLQSAYNTLQSIANLEQQQTVLSQYTINQGANTHTLVTSFQANYAGYLQLSLTSTTTNAYVIVEYWYQGRLFSVQRTLGTSGEAYFCILPASVAIYAGNTNYVNGATHTVTATYHY